MISEEEHYEDKRKPPPWAPRPPRRARMSPELCGAVILIGIITLLITSIYVIF